ncbi:MULTISPECIES: xylulokinase [unclassified Pseudomonas]|uniref:xylulokinase n=1 Tax=unclassified Pseudomonas TaxID=196821 RepID=UPI000D361AD0|nr:MULTISPECIES: xylulokinase [unclassified Pseudomonas]RAU45529.1 xylulokinase [Pseudomonas sp. RIT 409]RAU53088.1 xylulokinase [Pseudomonas sp. RIT 412]
MSDAVSLGIDLGTSELKAILLDSHGHVLAKAGAGLTTARRQPGWSEQDPLHWWQACTDALERLRSDAPMAWARIACIGLSGQMHGAVLLDAEGQVLYPAVLWDDSRAVEEAEQLNRDFPGYAQVTGSLAMAGLTAPKLVWLKQHAPAVFARVDCVLSPKDYLRLRLTGARASDVSDAAGTLWLDVANRTWYEPMLRACGLTLAQMPRLLEASEPAGCLTSEAAQALGLPRDLVVATGGGDNPVAAVGIGAIRAGDAFITLGTSAALVAITEHPAGNPARAVHNFCHALPDRWYTMGAMLAGASCLRWVTRLLGQPDERVLLEQVRAALPLDRPVPLTHPLFLPYLAGERTPHNDPLLRGGFMNLGHDCTPAMLGYAVLEGVGFGLLDAMNAVLSAGATVNACALVGGGARSDYWAQLLANIVDREIFTLQGSELSACIGAAQLGLLAIGHSEERLSAGLPIQARFQPMPAVQPALQARYAKFRSLLSAARGLHE